MPALCEQGETAFSQAAGEAGLIRSVADGRKRIITVRRGDIDKRFPGLLPAVLGSQ